MRIIYIASATQEQKKQKAWDYCEYHSIFKKT